MDFVDHIAHAEADFTLVKQRRYVLPNDLTVSRNFKESALGALTDYRIAVRNPLAT